MMSCSGDDVYMTFEGTVLRECDVVKECGCVNGSTVCVR